MTTGQHFINTKGQYHEIDELLPQLDTRVGAEDIQEYEFDYYIYNDLLSWPEHWRAWLTYKIVPKKNSIELHTHFIYEGLALRADNELVFPDDQEIVLTRNLAERLVEEAETGIRIGITERHWEK